MKDGMHFTFRAKVCHISVITPPDQMSNLLTAPVVGFMNGNIPAVIAIVVALQHVIGISKLICLWDIMD